MNLFKHKIKILIVEDEPLIAEDIKDFLLKLKFEVTTIAYNKISALNSLRNNLPDLALLDINLGNNHDGIKIAEKINDYYKIPFLYITSYATKSVLDLVKHTLPMGYVVKPFEENDLFAAIEIALSNFKKINKKKKLTLHLINKNLDFPISEREFPILIGIYNGLSNHQISEINFISINTVKYHIKNIFEKLDTHSKAQTILWLRNVYHKFL